MRRRPQVRPVLDFPSGDATDGREVLISNDTDRQDSAVGEGVDMSGSDDVVSMLRAAFANAISFCRFFLTHAVRSPASIAQYQI